MLERSYNLDRELGAVVPITVAPSYAEQERRYEQGYLNLLRPALAVLSTADPITVISAKIFSELELQPIGVETMYPLTLPEVKRARATAVITIDNEFRGRSVEAFIAVMPGPIECIIGRDILDAGLFRYDGPSAAFTLDCLANNHCGMAVQPLGSGASSARGAFAS